MKHQELYSELIKNGMNFLPRGEIEVKTIYKIVRTNFPHLCDDEVLCKDICTNGANQPEWKHRVRSALFRLKSQGLIEKSNRRGYWIVLSESQSNTPKAFDLSIGNTEPEKLETITYRILRDTKLTRQLKELYMDRCQICGETIRLSSGKTYSEAHHIKPLGSSHGGPDTAENILIVCPNHHVLCDYGAIKLVGSDLKLERGHNISEEYIKYHNENIYSKDV